MNAYALVKRILSFSRVYERLEPRSGFSYLTVRLLRD